ncbi:alpha-ketoglutarate decarboxylase [Bowdeniella nasicola]|uniref:Alpha-ketoglutarate decarboxylase n=1 Tax=Bowdeniella nasicola TaxID=208480 RepID=A0A1Q5Q1J1_9ACTO|nr:multifunctional oxoglutarate decarboxylase/oxoglutarate dehydrogenase thiamine pyrophosphate-binding subunit/dihydrolipoyllysine-residue succinyltransferase subunit [Bowdeniella nasicola]OKL53579.1 alpha-ketoglutarate decarboxylase [Bowdeniella nasicola]
MSTEEHPDDLASNFGANEWLIDELYEKYQADPSSVEQSWRDFFAKREGGDTPSPDATDTPAASEPKADEEPKAEPKAAKSEPAPAPKQAESESTESVSHVDPRQLISEAADFHDRGLPPVKAQAPTSIYAQSYGEVDEDDAAPLEDQVDKLRGPAARVVTNMETSLEIPTATSVRSVPAKLLIENRLLINSHLSRTRGGKVSFTHLIGFALIEALAEVPELNAAYDELDGKPAVKHPAHVNLGLAIDMPKPDGTRQLLVPSIKQSDQMDFAQFWAAYDDIVRKARNNKLTVDDFMGTTITLTNPGTIGTQFSIARLMKGQGAIIGVGAMDYPAEYQGASAKTIARIGVSKILSLSSTYDHRVIQGAASGELLKVLSTKLTGQDGFYDRVFSSLRMPYAPVRWQRDVEFDTKRELSKSARIAEMIHAFRSRGHLQADTDPLASRQRRFHDLDFTNHGLTLWDLDRTFPTGGFAGTDALTLREILEQLRDAYCRNVGIEYMHLQDPAQRAWFQERLERPFQKATNEEQLQILYKLNEAEAFETFLQTKFVGQKRFSLEGGESLIPMLDVILTSAAREGLDDVAIGMAHRGRLNVLANIAGKSYAQIFDEFEGNMDPRTVEGSGDVKYHLGTEGTYTTATGEHTNVYLAANPSHLETVNGVLEGIVRAKQDRIDLGHKGFSVLPILVHGDAAFAGQGVVQETLNLSQLRGYRTGGTMHIIVNNQIGFTTGPASSRSSQYCTDIVKGLQIPVFHVNGDDPEAVARVAKLAYDYRQEFNKDVVIDLVCYRRRGHNEGDDPSMTQPVMYSLIDNKASVRQLYQEALIGRGDISNEQAEQALEDFRHQLEEAFSSTKDESGHRKVDTGEGSEAVSAESDSVAGLELPSSQQEDAGVMVGWTTAVSEAMVERIGQAHLRAPEGFTVHPKLQKLLERRAQMTKEGGIDWGMGELLAFGSLLIEGVPVRLTGQDSRRGTFTQRHATLHDYETGAEWTPLQYLTEDQGKFWVYDSSLSEYVVLAYEYGYSVERPDALVLWEAQFGDFANGAQIVIDEFVSSSEQKWGQRSSVVMLLPHGYEGQGPDHSSGRIERFLQLCAEDNMIVAQPSTPANHFHLLRRQAYVRPRKPLIVFSPKQLLRLKAAASQLEDFTSGEFQPVIPDTSGASNVERVLLCSGRLYYDLAARRDKRGDTSTAIVRLEQLYPLPVEELQAELAKYGNAELVWVQDEPENQGPWYHIAMQLGPQLDRRLRVISRPAAASPSAGTMKLHKSQAEEIFVAAFDR